MTIYSTKVTIFMATYNAAPFIAQSIQSVLNQSFHDFELLIVNDGSTDNTVEIIESFQDHRIRLIENEGNKGLGFTRNVALKEARGEFLAILDSDDIAFPDRLEKQLDYFAVRPQLAALGGYAHIIDKNGNRTGKTMTPPHGSDLIRATLFFSNTFVHSTVMMRTSVFREVGGYPNHPVAQDYALFAKIGVQHEVNNIPEYLVEYRMHETNISIRKKHLLDNELQDILISQLRLLLPTPEYINTNLLLEPVQGSPYGMDEYYTLYKEIILQNRKRKIYPLEEFEKIFFDKWLTIAMDRGKSRTFGLLLKDFTFLRYITFKHFRKAFKKSLRHILGIEK